MRNKHRLISFMITVMLTAGGIFGGVQTAAMTGSDTQTVEAASKTKVYKTKKSFQKKWKKMKKGSTINVFHFPTSGYVTYRKVSKTEASMVKYVPGKEYWPSVEVPAYLGIKSGILAWTGDYKPTSKKGYGFGVKVVKVEPYAFSKCKKEDIAYISYNVRELCPNAFSGMSSLNYVDVSNKKLSTDKVKGCFNNCKVEWVALNENDIMFQKYKKAFSHENTGNTTKILLDYSHDLPAILI